MGLDITIKIKDEEYDFNGRNAFNPLIRFMKIQHEYEYAKELKLTVPIIESMVRFICEICVDEEDEDYVDWRASMIPVLVKAAWWLNQDAENVATWCADW